MPEVNDLPNDRMSTEKSIMPTVLFTAPYMIPVLERFRSVLDQHHIELIERAVMDRQHTATIGSFGLEGNAKP